MRSQLAAGWVWSTSLRIRSLTAAWRSSSFPRSLPGIPGARTARQARLSRNVEQSPEPLARGGSAELATDWAQTLVAPYRSSVGPGSVTAAEKIEIGETLYSGQFESRMLGVLEGKTTSPAGTISLTGDDDGDCNRSIFFAGTCRKKQYVNC
jgi:hypothetical protein